MMEVIFNSELLLIKAVKHQYRLGDLVRCQRKKLVEDGGQF
jgi:hypothetical protein